MFLSWEVYEVFTSVHEELTVTEIVERVSEARSQGRTVLVRRIVLSVFRGRVPAMFIKPSHSKVERALRKLEKRRHLRSHIDVMTFPRVRKYHITPK